MSRICCRTAIESVYVMLVRISDEEALRHERTRRCVIVVVWFTSSLIIALAVPNIGVVISLLGGLAALFAFVLPGCHLALHFYEFSHE